MGTGAKYTAIHVERSCDLAAQVLATLDCSEAEISRIITTIQCTGINSQIELLSFPSEEDRLTGCRVATADYLGQMAYPAYLQKLPFLYPEIEESNDYNNVLTEKRPFKSAQDLMAKTRGFWIILLCPSWRKTTAAFTGPWPKMMAAILMSRRWRPTCDRSMRSSRVEHRFSGPLG
jgi:hypothetical protein